MVFDQFLLGLESKIIHNVIYNLERIGINFNCGEILKNQNENAGTGIEGAAMMDGLGSKFKETKVGWGYKLAPLYDKVGEQRTQR